MKRKLIATFVMALAIFPIVACSSGSEPVTPQDVQAQPGQPPSGAVTNPSGQTARPTLANQPMSPQTAEAQPNQPPAGAATRLSGQATPVPGQPGMAGRPGIAGTVKSVSGNAIQLTVQNGNAIAVQVDDKTVYEKYVAGTLADIQVGSRLIVSGETSGGVTKAQTIQIAPNNAPAGGTPPNPRAGQPPTGGIPPAPPGGQQGGAPPGGAQPGQLGGQPGVGGTVKSVSGNTIQLTGFDGSVTTVQVDSKTVIQKSASATLSDIKAGVQITVIVDSSTGSNIARIIRIETTK